MKKADVILLLSVLLFALALFMIFRLAGQGEEKLIRVMIDNEIVDEFPLEQDIIKKYETENGYNILIISNGKAYISEADCYNQVCVNSGEISECGQSLVCLPHKMAVTIENY